MSVVGVDFGSMNTVIACARNRGVDVITNEVSNRATPSLVGFGPKNRYIGEAAKTQEISNLKNTIGSLVRLCGRAFKDPEVQIEQEFVTAPLVDINGFVGAEVTYLGKRERYTATQLIAMYLGKIRATAAAELKTPVNDMVISCPAWYTDGQRRLMIDAAEIAGLKVLQLINETTATALGWGIVKTDLPDNLPDVKARTVAFIDIGNSNYTCSIVNFRKGELKVQATACDRHFGGRNFDKALVDHFAKEFKEKYKIDINENLKARVRVAAGCEKLKKILSANASAPLNIESLMNDIDVKGFLKREELEELVKPLLEKAIKPLEQALATAKLTVADIDAVELVGGCTRVPALKNAIQNFFGKTLSFTLNQDEAIARGCAFSCAIWSPVFRVRDFKVHDTLAYPIEFTWEKVPDVPDEETTLQVMPPGNKFPDTKLVTFYRKKPFDLEVRYSDPSGLPGKVNPWIARFSIKGVKPNEAGDFMVCKFKPKVDVHGIVRLEQAYYVEDEEVEETVPAEKADEMQTDQPNGTEEQAAPKKVKKVKAVKKGDLPVTGVSTALDDATKISFSELENSMAADDKLVLDTEEKKNELETYIYDLRGKLDEQYSEFASEQEKDKVREKLTASEDWLYEDGEDATKAVYVSKIEEIRFVAGPIVQRYLDKVENERQAARQRDEERAAAKAAEREASKRAEEAAKGANGPSQADGAAGAGAEDVEMSEADGDAKGGPDVDTVD